MNALPLAPKRVQRLMQRFNEDMELRQSPSTEGGGKNAHITVPATVEIFGTKVQAEINRTARRTSLGQILRGRFSEDAGRRGEDVGGTCLLSGEIQKIYRTQAVSSCT